MSKTSPFPVYENLVLSGKVVPRSGLKFFDASEAFSVIPKSARLENFGPVTPPYDSLWLEGEDVSRDGHVHKVAVHVEANAPSVTLHGRRSVVRHRATSYGLIRGSAKRNAVMACFTVKEDGTFGEVAAALRPEERSWADSLPEERIDIMVDGAARAVGLALFAISLMHCRNIKQEAVTYAPQQRRKTSRQRPAVEYHKIHLPTPKASGGGSGALTGTQKLHTARGHFKTYTEDAPLMGHHVGTYYWGWQVRGNKKNGEIISSYEVGAAS